MPTGCNSHLCSICQHEGSIHTTDDAMSARNVFRYPSVMSWAHFHGWLPKQTTVKKKKKNYCWTSFSPNCVATNTFHCLKLTPSEQVVLEHSLKHRKLKNCSKSPQIFFKEIDPPKNELLFQKLWSCSLRHWEARVISWMRAHQQIPVSAYMSEISCSKETVNMKNNIHN